MPHAALGRCLALTGLAALGAFAPAAPAPGASLRFHGNGVDDIDRVKIAIDDPQTAAPGPPADVGATDVTIEFWMRAAASENTAAAVSCGPNIDWIYGNILLDRDRYNQDRKFGLSIAGGRVVFGVSGDGTGDRTICSTSGVLDDAWHHVAVARRRSDGWLWLFVDGVLEANADGPDGDVSYPDEGVPGNFCGGPCTNSDPFLVLGAEKHDAGPTFPSYSGWLDELRLSSVLRYASSFTPPAQPFASDAGTVALYHFDEGSGDAIGDASGAAGGPSPGVRRFGGSPAGPEWSFETPFAPTGVGAQDGADAGPTGAAPGARALGLRLVAAPNPFRGRTVIAATIDGVDGPEAAAARAALLRAATLSIHDASGRKIAEIVGRAAPNGVEFAWDAGPARAGVPGVSFARLTAGGATATLKLVAAPAP
jgi:hypothetical protein